MSSIISLQYAWFGFQSKMFTTTSGQFWNLKRWVNVLLLSLEMRLIWIQQITQYGELWEKNAPFSCNMQFKKNVYQWKNCSNKMTRCCHHYHGSTMHVWAFSLDKQTHHDWFKGCRQFCTMMLSFSIHTKCSLLTIISLADGFPGITVDCF